MSQRPRLQQHHWVGIYTADFTLGGVRERCLRLADALLANKWSCLVAHDTRFMAGQFARYAYRLLEARGVQVSFCPTPAPFPAVELALEQRRADTALILTAGNQPFWYCGMIALTPALSQPLLEDNPVAQADAGEASEFPAPALDSAERNPFDLRGPYLEALRATVDIDLIRRTTLTVFVDPMNGTTSGYVPAAIGEGGQTKAIEINRETDPLFGRQPPHPAEAGLNRLRKLVKESDSHLGVALSADGRAISVADSAGELVSALDLMRLLAIYLSRQHRQRGLVIGPLPPEGEPASLRAWADEAGLKVELLADPAARIAELVAQDRTGLLVGATAAGELTLGRFSGSPDATLVALMLIEVSARFGGKLRALMDETKGKA
ncbi:MAG TPA: phosphoglucomutase [Roseiflexaceae bacterium]|nr:phosphoglucomutase [Roseiflexaceae bacterium]